MPLREDLVAGLGEFVGTTLFLLMAFGGAKTALLTTSTSQNEGVQAVINNQTLMYIALSFGLSLLVNAWVFYRITGGLFNPAITLALFLCGGLSPFRAALLTVSQILAGIAAAALLAALTPFGGAQLVLTTLGTHVNVAQGLFIEAFLTAVLVLTVLFLAVEKHKGTYLAPIGIGLTLFGCHLFGVVWTGCGINPARAFGPSVVSGSFPGYHWIYWLGPILGSLTSVGFYKLLLLFDYTSIAFAQDASKEEAERLERGEEPHQQKKPEKEDGGKTGSGEKQDQEKEGQSEPDSHGPPARGRVIMVYPSKRLNFHHQQGRSNVSSQNNVETLHDTESVVVDLDEVTFYEADANVGTTS
ncbi:hypothetical protein CBS101457_004894 [Exobasidium rhododendri]|nr:hypothetical protein CBS101457_004894 [Exobasidium rhododendri]